MLYFAIVSASVHEARLGRPEQALFYLHDRGGPPASARNMMLIKQLATPSARVTAAKARRVAAWVDHRKRARKMVGQPSRDRRANAAITLVMTP